MTILSSKFALPLLITIGAVTAAVAEPTTFDFKDPKGVNNVVFQTDAPLESINGTANGISGTITVDPENPEKTTGKIIVATESLTVPNSIMHGHLLGKKWLDAKAHPEITFEVKSVSEVKKKNNSGQARVTGIFSLHGVSKKITVDAQVTYLPGKLGERSGGKMEGDLLVIRSKFTINRSDYKIQPGENTDKVAEEVSLSLSIAGAAPKK